MIKIIKKEHDQNGNVIFEEDSKGRWEKGNRISNERSNGSWEKYQFDKNNNRILVSYKFVVRKEEKS